jgi:hypothetical protein
VGVTYGPRSVPVSVEVSKKRKADATGKVLVKRLKVLEKKRAETAKVTMAQVKGGLKRSSDTDITSAKSAKLSKNIVPRTLTSAAMAHITLEAPGPKNVFGDLSSKAGGGGSGSKTAAGAKKATMLVKKHILHCTVRGFELQRPRFSHGRSLVVNPQWLRCRGLVLRLLFTSRHPLELVEFPLVA